VTIAANSLTTGPAGANTAPAAASLSVVAPGGGGGGGGAIGWTDLLLGASALLLVRGRLVRRRA
jgi:hypothetical protein